MKWKNPVSFQSKKMRHDFVFVIVCLFNTPIPQVIARFGPWPAFISTAYVFTIYVHNGLLSEPRAACLKRMADVPALKSYYWIRKNTKPDDVFLCGDRFSMRVVGPAARKVVATHPTFQKYLNSVFVYSNLVIKELTLKEK